MEAEVWASMLLGVFWKQRFDPPSGGASPGEASPGEASPGGASDYALAHGAPLIRAIARLGGRGARVALRAIARVDDGELGVRAGELAERLGDRDGLLPSWIEDVGEAEILRSAVVREEIFDDGFTVFIEACHGGRDRHAVGIYIDNNLGVMAKDALLTDSIERVEEIMRKNPSSNCGELKLEPLDPRVAAGHVYAAIRLTDLTMHAPVGDDYACLRAFALLRADGAPGPHVEPQHSDIAPAERRRLRDEFLSSPEGREFAADSDEAYIASLAIDFCADCVDGRPLRWSPVVVELFMANWMPLKALAGRELF